MNGLNEPALKDDNHDTIVILGGSRLRASKLSKFHPLMLYGCHICTINPRPIELSWIRPVQTVPCLSVATKFSYFRTENYVQSQAWAYMNYQQYPNTNSKSSKQVWSIFYINIQVWPADNWCITHSLTRAEPFQARTASSPSLHHYYYNMLYYYTMSSPTLQMAATLSFYFQNCNKCSRSIHINIRGPQHRYHIVKI